MTARGRFLDMRLSTIIVFILVVLMFSFFLFTKGSAAMEIQSSDFVESGRAVGAYHGNLLKTAINLASASEAIKYTNYSFNDATLSKLKRFFDSQRLYPELLEHATTSGNSSYSSIYPTANASDLNASFIKEARFLHLDIQSHTKSPTEALGDDMYNVSYVSGTIAPPPTSHTTIRSVSLSGLPSRGFFFLLYFNF